LLIKESENQRGAKEESEKIRVNYSKIKEK